MAAKRKEKIENDTRTLIKLITGFQEKSENFHLCLTFAESNFKYHRFLTPDSHKIHRIINGLCEKFEVHSQKQKATDLQELTSTFLEQPGLDGRETGKTDVHYALLSLLLELACSPIKTEFERKQKHVVPEEADNFDWKSYLLNDLNLNFISYASSSSDEDEVSEASSSDEEQQLDKADIHSRQQSLSTHGSDHQVPSQVLPSGEAKLHDNPLTGDECTKLEQVLVVEYWKGKGKEDDLSGGHSASNLARDWKFYKRQLSLLQSTESRCVVTEQQILRESIWMLTGVTDLFIFKYSSNEFSLNPDVYVMHLTSECLESSLKPLMRKANQLCALQTFVTDVVSQVTSAIECGRQSGIPQTYQAFVTCVSQFLSDLRAKLLELEKVIMKQEELMSLAMLSSKLQPWFDKVQTVHSVYVSGVASVSSENARQSSSNCFKAAHLLDILYQALFELDLISLVDKTGRKNVILEMLIKSSQPLIEITSVWISNGQLIDPAEEFVIQRNREIKSLDETFWEKAFVSNHIPTPEVGITSSAASKESSNLEVAHTSRFPLTNKTITSASISSQQSDSIEFIVSHGPKLLQPILADAILTGKSMEMLENLGRISEVQDTSLGVFERPPSLFELFVSDLRAKLGEKTHSKHPSSESASGKISTKITHGDGLLTKLLQMKGVKDSLLTINSASLMSHCKIPADKNKTDRSVPDGKCGLSPLLRICESCLYPHMRARYQTVCIKLVHILKTEYHLISCIQAMQRYYLMSSGEIMYDFYTQIFHKMSKKEEWREASLLEMYLHEAVTPRYPSDVSRLSVVVKSPSSFHDKSPISATDCINLNYNVPWPLNVVISGKCQELYNSIFCFLLQVKRAKYVQDELKFEDLAREQAVARLAHEDDNETMPRHKRIHRCQLFRFRLLYFINSLHNYIMTRILHSTGLEFATQLEGATDLEQIISIHRGYVQAIHERCLLHHKLSVLKEAVMKVLNLSLTFSLLWRQGVDFIHGETILSMETELTRCIHFLAVFLNNVIKRGSFPHLESLAFALVSSLQNVEM